MPKEMREYENQEMESNESPFPRRMRSTLWRASKKEQASAMEEPADPAIPHRHPPCRSRATQTAARRSSVVAICGAAAG